MSEHVRELLSLRDGSVDGELLYRKQIMRLLGAEPEPGLSGLGMVHRVRRVEGKLTIPDKDGELTGLVMFAVGDDGKGNLSDVRSKSAQPSAKSSLVARGADFVVLVTTGEPSDAVMEIAEAKSELFYLGSSLRRRVWVMGVPEVVARAEQFLVERGAVPAKKGLWGWFTRTFVPEENDVPVSPLQLKLESFDRVDREELELPAE